MLALLAVLACCIIGPSGSINNNRLPAVRSTGPLLIGYKNTFEGES